MVVGVEGTIVDVDVVDEHEVDAVDNAVVEFEDLFEFGVQMVVDYDDVIEY